MAKRTSLSVHRNTVEKRRRVALRSDLLRAMSGHLRDVDVRAYALVTVSASGQTEAFWDTGAIMPMVGFPAVVGAALQRSIEESGVHEDWRPPLPLKGSGI